jgi:arylsulfatase A-like enzyme
MMHRAITGAGRDPDFLGFALRVENPCVVRWPGKIKPGTVSNEIVAHYDWLPTFVAMAGDPDITDKLLKGCTIAGMTYQVHLDGYNLVPYLTGQAEKSPRVSFIYCNDDQQVVALRYDNWKIVFEEQGHPARSGSGPSRSPPCACQRSSISGPIRSSAPTSPRTPITIG